MNKHSRFIAVILWGLAVAWFAFITGCDDQAAGDSYTPPPTFGGPTHTPGTGTRQGEVSELPELQANPDPCLNYGPHVAVSLRDDSVLQPDYCMSRVPELENCSVSGLAPMTISCDWSCGETTEVRAHFPESGKVRITFINPCLGQAV